MKIIEEKYPYYMKGASVLKPLVSKDKDKYLAMASLIDIGQYVPDIDTTANIDVLPVAFNAFVANRANANGDILGTETTLATHQNFINKPINIEHDRGKIVGVILSSAFSEFGTDKPLEASEIKGDTPFNVVLGGVIWRIADQGLAATIEDSSDPASIRFGSISASWELGFADFELAKATGTSKNLEDCTICDDDEIIAALGDNYKFGEPNSDNGEILFRKPVGSVVPLGIGLTGTPAADVVGVASPKTIIVPDEQKKIEADRDDDEYKGDKKGDKKSEKKDHKKDDKKSGKKDEKKDSKKEGKDNFFNKKNKKSDSSDVYYDSSEEALQALNVFLEENELTLREYTDDLQQIASYKKSNELEKNISHSNKKNVIETRSENKIMRITSLDQINQDSMKELQASAVRDYLSEQIQEASDKYVADKEAAAQSLEIAKTQFESITTEFEAAKAEVTKLTTEKEALEADKAEAVKSEQFNERMASLDSEYELSDDVRKVLAKQLKDVDDDEAFKSWQEGMAVFMTPFVKKAETVTTEEVVASETVEAALENGEAQKVEISNTSAASASTDKWAGSLQVADIDLS
jgi:hypothetical protein